MLISINVLDKYKQLDIYFKDNRFQKYTFLSGHQKWWLGGKRSSSVTNQWIRCTF